MNYLVRRGDAQFGPYSLAEMQRYLQSGQILPEDLTQSEGMTEWLPVSQVVGTIAVPPQATTGAAASLDNTAPARVPLPPNLPWWILLVLVFITRQFFNMIWAVVLANWARKMSGKNTPLVLVAMYPAAMLSGIIAMGASQGNTTIAALGGFLILAGAISSVFGVFSIKSAMEDYYSTVENIHLSLSGAMTFFFGVIYLQYHVNDLARARKSALSIA